MNPDQASINRFFLYKSAIVASLAGFLFGFDTVVISGAEQIIQDLWGLNSTQHGLAVSIALWGTVIGAMTGGYPSQYFGRRKTLLWIGALYLISAIGSALAPEVNLFMISRFIGGLGVGISTVAAPMYISEISPPEFRGRLTGMFQLNIVLGILDCLSFKLAAGKYWGKCLEMDAGGRSHSRTGLCNFLLLASRESKMVDSLP